MSFRVPVTTQEPVRVDVRPPVEPTRIAAVLTGAPSKITAPPYMMWDIERFAIRLSTDANVANRQIVIRLNVPNIYNPVYTGPWNDYTLYQPASTIRYYSWTKGGSYSVRTGTSYDGETHALPLMPLYDGASYNFGLENGQAGDALVLCYEGYEDRLER